MANEVANEILRQLGSGKFVAMTGAHSFGARDNSLTFKLPRTAKDRIKGVRITLDASDTYTMTFFAQANAPTFEVKTVAEFSFVYNDQLTDIFTRTTGLEVRL